MQSMKSPNLTFNCRAITTFVLVLPVLGTMILGSPLFTSLLVTAFAWKDSGTNAQISRADADFNGDGFADLAIGVIGEDVIAVAVNVLYGSSGVGLTSSGDQIWTQDSPGIEGTAESVDEFGYSVR